MRYFVYKQEEPHGFYLSPAMMGIVAAPTWLSAQESAMMFGLVGQDWTGPRDDRDGLNLEQVSELFQELEQDWVNHDWASHCGIAEVVLVTGRFSVMSNLYTKHVTKHSLMEQWDIAHFLDYGKEKNHATT